MLEVICPQPIWQWPNRNQKAKRQLMLASTGSLGQVFPNTTGCFTNHSDSEEFVLLVLGIPPFSQILAPTIRHIVFGMTKIVKEHSGSIRENVPNTAATHGPRMSACAFMAAYCKNSSILNAKTCKRICERNAIRSLGLELDRKQRKSGEGTRRKGTRSLTRAKPSAIRRKNHGWNNIIRSIHTLLSARSQRDRSSVGRARRRRRARGRQRR
jgi:hypothetical protein